MKVIAHIESPFKEKFGIPRQSNLVTNVISKIVFESEYRVKEALKGLDGFSHIWIIWEFSECKNKPWSPTVRPPRLGGNERMGVFATRSPFRPNSIGLSSVKIEKIAEEKGKGTVIYVSGADLLDKTPIYDIKPYLPYTDCHNDATSGFTENLEEKNFSVVFTNNSDTKITKDEKTAITELLKQDPRPSYQNDEERIYGISYDKYDIKFSVKQTIIYVISINTL